MLDTTPRNLSIKLSDQALSDLQLLLSLACGRSHTTTHGRAKTKACFLFTVLDVERSLRGLPAPPAGGHASSLSPTNIA